MLTTLVAVVAAWAILRGGIFHPGPLHAGRAVGDSLGGISAHDELRHDCGACHVAPWGKTTMAARCLECHTDVQGEIADTSTLHGSLTQTDKCLTCHTEHQGSRASLTRMDDVGEWHGRLGFSLAQHRQTAARRPFTCADCHPPDTFEFDARDCVECHSDYQRDFIITHVRDWGEDCQACHDGVRWAAQRFDHNQTAFSLAGEHEGITCTECHPETRAYDDFLTGAVTCFSCHREDDVHDGELGTDCGTCHGANSWEGATFDHTFPLDHGSRSASKCAICHEDGPRSYQTYTCYGCHEHTLAGIRSEHLEEGINDYDNCMECHPTGQEDEGEGDHER